MSTTTNHGDKLREQMNAENPGKEDYSKPDEQIVNRVQIVGTPFWSIGIKTETGWTYSLVIGNNKLNRIELENHEGVLAYLEANKWEIIFSMITIVTQGTINQLTNINNKEMADWMKATKKTVKK